MCGRFEQSETRECYARAIGVDTRGPKWVGGDTHSPIQLKPWGGTVDTAYLNQKLKFDHVRWGYRTPKDVEEKRRPWINARIEKVLTGRYFRHMLRESRGIVPGGGWLEWIVENGKKQPWYILRKDRAPIFMAGLTNFRPYTRQTVEVGFVIVTQDCEGGMVDIQDRRPVFWNRRTPGTGWTLVRQLRKRRISRRRALCQPRPLPGGKWTGR